MFYISRYIHNHHFVFYSVVAFVDIFACVVYVIFVIYHIPVSIFVNILFVFVQALFSLYVRV